MQQSLAFYFFVCLCCILVAGERCVNRGQCCSLLPDYVACVNRTCTCLTDQGFSGNATSANPCHCGPGNSIYWDRNLPYCINLPLATKLQVNKSLAAFLENQVMQVFTNMVYPTPVSILNKSMSLDNIFNPNASGRIDPLTIIMGSTALAEYFYSFTVQPAYPGGPLAYVNAVDFVSLSVNMTSPLPKVFNRVRIRYVLAVGNNIIPAFNYTISGTFTMGLDNRIAKLDQIIHNVGFTTDVKLSNRTSYIVQFCQGYSNICNQTYDPTGYYTDFDDCFDYLMSDNVRKTTWNGQAGNLPADYDQGAGNTIVCRTFHLGMARYDPVIHCAHAGKNGGGFCTDAANGLFGPKPGPYYTNYDSDIQNQFD